MIETIKNPDEQFVRNLKKRIKDNGKYCLNKEKGNPNNKCPCRQYRDTGNCECGMYISVEDLFWDIEEYSV